MASSPPGPDGTVPSILRSKRAVNPLLPAFEPLSSSPSLPRPLKRSRDAFNEAPTYPTPVPTSSTAILSSSPPGLATNKHQKSRSLSMFTERIPLSAVPTIELQSDGRTTRMGRSSASCDYQFSSNRLISRVHVSAAYKPATSRLERERVEITCWGWNGIKIHCQSKVYDLKKGEKFSSDVRDAEIMVDVHDNRVAILWPEKIHLGPTSSDEDEEQGSPLKKQRALLRHSTPPSPSPMQSRRRPASPVSPSPAVRALLPSSPPISAAAVASQTVEIYEDPDSAEDDQPADEESEALAPTQIMSQNVQDAAKSQDTVPSATQDFSDNDEENDPIIHSFGPFGANILPRMASFTAADSPRPNSSVKTSRSSHMEPLQPSQSPAQVTTQPPDLDVRSHIINQLAFSRLSSTPLSTILSHLPRDAGVMIISELQTLISDTNCIGEVIREGKDAAGKALESEYYYIPDRDTDDKRKEAVVNDLMKPGLRACRKQHKQYFWRKPK